MPIKPLIAALALLLAAAAPAPAAAQGHWTRAWTASMLSTSEESAVLVEDATIRAAVRVGAGGKAIRLRLSNEYGANPLTIGAATIRRAGQPAVRVTFGGSATAKIPAGAPLVSDPVTLPVAAFEVVEVSLYLPGSNKLTTIHEARGQPTLISPQGDHTMGDFAAVHTSYPRPLIAGIDVRTPEARPIVVAFGDSITDNVGCANDAVPVCRWGDVLGRRLAKAGKPHVVITQAISGNRILAAGAGPSALARFDRDVLAVPGVSHVVLLEGINDIGNSGRVRGGVAAPKITADELIAAYRQLVLRAHERGIKVIAMTILPYEGAGYATPEGEAIRMAANDFIRNSGVFDAVIDMEKIVADPANPKRLAPSIQGEKGDNLHPHGAGETAMGEAIDLRLFR